MKRTIIAIGAALFVVVATASTFTIITRVGEMETAAQKVTQTCVVEPIVTATEPVTKTMVVKPRVELYDVPLDDEIQLRVIQLCEAHHIEPSIVIAMIKCESNFNATNVGDNGNSFGLMQIQPRWHSKRMQELGCNDLFDPCQNVSVGVDYLVELLDRYGSIDKALTAYNRGSYNGVVTDYAKNVIQTAETLKKKGA